MLQREEDIKSIMAEISMYLSGLEHYIKLSNSQGLYDIDIIMEDFFCELLNLLYGYELTNLNKKVKNAKAIDLCDSKHRIAVQVTSKNTRDKVNETIDKFVEDKLYEKYDRLLVVFSKDKPKSSKPYDTKGKFHFNPETDLLDTRDLINQISAADSQKLQAIRYYIECEMEQRHKTKIESVEKKEDKPAKKLSRPNKKLLFPAVGFALLAALCIIAKPLAGKDMGTETKGEVYLSYLAPYTTAGIHTSFQDVPPIEQMEIETRKAFSILSFVRSNGEKSSMVEHVYCDILALEPIHESAIVLDAEMAGHTLRLFAFNNGWGDGKALAITKASLQCFQEEQDLEDVCQEIQIEENLKTPAADVSLLAEYTLDDVKFQEFYRNLQGPLEISIQAEEEGKSEPLEWRAYIRYENGEFHLEYGGDGFPEYYVTLFAVLDVDQKPSQVSFTGKNATPVVNDKFRIETVLAPTKSCMIQCRNVFSINGEPQATQTYTAHVTVPVFTDDSIGRTGALTQEMARFYGKNPQKVRQALKKYLYDPNSVLEDGSQGGFQ